jgi:hypothetical protein
MDLGFSIQFSRGNTNTSKRAMLWLYPSDGTEVLSPVALFDQYIEVPDIADYNTAEIYVSLCVNKMIEHLSNIVQAGEGQRIVELMLALNKHKIQ